MAVPTSKIRFGFFTAKSTFIKLCISLRIMGTPEERASFSTFQKLCISQIQRIDISSHPLLYDHELLSSSCSASPAMIAISLEGSYAVLRR